MIGSNIKKALAEQVGAHPGPVLSLYLDVNPANPDNTPKAFVLRAAEAMRAAGMDKRYIEAVTSKLSQDFVIARGRSLVVFAGEDPELLFDAYYLQTRLPLLNLADGALANWGQPYLAPLLYALDQKERYALVYVSAERVRVFEAFLGQIEELGDFEREVDTEAWRPYRHARRSPAIGAGVAARGGAAVDAYRDRLDEATARHYRSLLPEIESRLAREDVDRLILIGTPAALAAFQEQLGNDLRERVVGTLPPPSNPDGPARDWLPLASGLMARAEAEHEMALLDRVREGGVWGVQEVLSLLQQHRLHALVTPWAPDLGVYRTGDGRVAASAEEAEALSPDQTVEEVPLLEVLPDLVARSGTALEFVAGEAEERLEREFAGLAGITRW